MKFSLFFFPVDAGPPGRDKYRLILEASRLADALGFHAIWTPERHFQRFGGPCPNAAVLGAALAGVTKRVRIRAGSVVLPLHHPVRVAEDFALVDNLSDGRVEIACVSGWHPDDYVLAPQNYSEREKILAEGVALIGQLWSGETVLLPNGSGQPTPTRLYPTPVQSQLRFWRVCQREESCQRAGASGSDVLTSMLGTTEEQLTARVRAFRAGAAAAPVAPNLALMLHTYLGPNAATIARPAYRRYLQSNLEFQRSAGAALGGTVPTATEKDIELIHEHAFARLTQTHGLIGTVAACADRVAHLQTLGIDEIACLVDFGIEPDQVLDGIRTLDQLRRQFA